MEPRELRDKPADGPHLIFKRGKRFPRANAWFGFSSFWGHLFHLAASVIATEDIDARDWMHANTGDDLTDAIGRWLTGDLADLEGIGTARAVTDALDDDLWIDFIADTGDDAAVSEAVADMLFSSFRLPSAEDDGTEVLPRGRVLLFGGDTAYPVATDLEIHNRVCVPFNRVLTERADGVPRVLLGIPGNHDWYDGLDGFARMFRARQGELTRTQRESMLAGEGVPHEAEAEELSRATVVDRTGQIGHFFHWVEAFRVGNNVAKRPTLPLLGYTPLQAASYFAVTLAPKLDLWGVDRQLRTVDYTQQSFFMNERGERHDHGRVVVIADPAHANLEPYEHGQATLEAVDVDFEEEGGLVLTGDTHHYCRQNLGEGMHVIAGGGGAFLHPARIDRRGKRAPEGEFPGPKASAALVLQVPWQLAYGRAGFIAHAAVALLYLPIFSMHFANLDTWPAQVVVGGVAAAAAAVLGGWRNPRRWLSATLAMLLGAWVALIPGVSLWATHALQLEGLNLLFAAAITLVAATFAAVLGFGTYLMVLTLLGIEHNQAYASLAHPGYKHFVRLRVARGGDRIDAWAIGKVDTLDDKAEIVLVDRWTWNNPAHGDAS